MSRKFQMKRGLKANLPTLAVAEPAFTTDEGKMYVGSDNGNVAIAREDHSHNYAGSSSAGGDANAAMSMKAITTAGTGAAYTATVPGITSLTKGISFVIAVHTSSTTTTPTLNVNGLGAKGIRRRLSNLASSVQAGGSASWLFTGKPFRVLYDGSYWIVEGLTKPAAADLYGSLTVDQGGTGATTAAEARANLGVPTVYSGTTEPDPDVGEEGDIYIQYTE